MHGKKNGKSENCGLALNTLKLIRETVGQIQLQFNDTSYTDSERKLLESALNNLYDEEDIIINNSLQVMVGKLNTSNEDLVNIITDMQNASAKITQFANRIKNISTVIGTLAEITSKAISAGII